MQNKLPPQIVNEFAPSEIINLRLGVLRAYGILSDEGASEEDLLDADRLYILGKPQTVEPHDWKNLYTSFNKFCDSIKLQFIRYVLGGIQ